MFALMHPHIQRETFASFLPQQPATFNSLVHHYFIISSCISSQDGKTTESCEDITREITEDSINSVNMSEPRVKRIKTCLPLCKTHISSAGSLARQNFPTVVEESLCGVSTLLMEVSYRLEALVRTLL